MGTGITGAVYNTGVANLKGSLIESSDTLLQIGFSSARTHHDQKAPFSLFVAMALSTQALGRKAIQELIDNHFYVKVVFLFNLHCETTV